MPSALVSALFAFGPEPIILIKLIINLSGTIIISVSIKEKDIKVSAKGVDTKELITFNLMVLIILR